MPPALHRTIVVSLVATMAIVSGVGEALHCLPGCGHGVEVGDRILLLGGSGACDRCAGDDRPHVDRPDCLDLPVYAQGQCAICSTLGKTCTSADSAELVLVVPLVHDVSAVVLSVASAPTVGLFQARAPPLV